MVSRYPYQSVEPILSPLQMLVSASGASNAQCIRMIFALDAKCAEISRATSEVMIGQMRLAWWRDALAQASVGGQPPGEPLLDALLGQPLFAAFRPHLITLVDGWEELIVAGEHPDEAQVLAFAQGRGGGLFGAIAAAMGGMADEDIALAGALWALWDLSGHVRDSALALRAITLARGQRRLGSKIRPRPLAILTRLAQGDIAHMRSAPHRMTLRLYLRVLRIQFLGR